MVVAGLARGWRHLPDCRKTLQQTGLTVRIANTCLFLIRRGVRVQGVPYERHRQVATQPGRDGQYQLGRLIHESAVAIVGGSGSDND